MAIRARNGIVSDVGANEWYMKMSDSNNTSRDKISMAQHPSRESPMIFITRQGLWQKDGWQEDEKVNRS
jgi:hypothetical protein